MPARSNPNPCKDDTRHVSYVGEQLAETAHVWSVSEVNRTVRGLLEQALQPMCVRGEIGNLTIHRSGHVYFSLKDSRSQLSAVFFRGAQIARQLELRTGIEVEVQGRLSVYEPRGQYQILVSSITPKGTGALQQRFEELKGRLRAEGLFDPDRKRPIPMLPRCVGVVTSPEGAAIRDFLRILGRRFATVHVRVAPCAVQGGTAAPAIARAITFLNDTSACDVIVVTRGGGSLEDLWAFNEETVARAVAGSRIPVVSAVGHERDVTICDFVADLRVATPSAAAELVIAGKSELVDKIRSAQQRIVGALKLKLSNARRRLDRAARSPVFREPAGMMRMYQQRLDELSGRLARAMEQQLERAGARVDRARNTLRALDPKRVLDRGYAILIDQASGQAVRAAAEVTEGDGLRGILAQGELRLLVQSRLVPLEDEEPEAVSEERIESDE